jgi:hypothetical protein
VKDELARTFAVKERAALEPLLVAERNRVRHEANAKVAREAALELDRARADLDAITEEQIDIVWRRYAEALSRHDEVFVGDARRNEYYTVAAYLRSRVDRAARPVIRRNMDVIGLHDRGSVNGFAQHISGALAPDGFRLPQGFGQPRALPAGYFGAPPAPAAADRFYVAAPAEPADVGFEDA